METIRKARAADLANICALLRDSGLPDEDLTRAALDHFWVVSAGEEIISVIGLEMYGDVALLRSLAVAKSQQRKGWGSRLTAHLENAAKTGGIIRLYLLTTTAQDFFAARQYQVIARREAPAAIQASQEFASLCPETAVCMFKALA